MPLFSNSIQNVPNQTPEIYNKPLLVQEAAVENKQSTLNGLIWAGMTCLSGTAALGLGLLTSATFSMRHADLTFDQTKLHLNMDGGTQFALFVGTLALSLLSAQCYKHMASHLSLSHKVQQLEANAI